ncbi:MAG: hypothetical protein BM485_13970 [Desulfobulbaceae bacterium DB1]|nr:MAG: hypothetical protein BM485_13970 [Desulfobulbaceae bacterium DB1]
MKFFISGSISKKLALLVMLSLLPALGIFLYSGMEQRRHSIEGAKHDVLLLAHSMAEVQKGIAGSARQLLSTLSQMPPVQDMDSRAGSELFRSMVAQNADYLGITLTDTAGKVVASNRLAAGMDMSDRKHIRDSLATRGFVAGEYFVARGGAQEPSFSFSSPVLDTENRLMGSLSVVIGLERFADFFDVSSLPAKSFLAVTDHQGIRLFYYPPKKDTNPLGKPILTRNWELVRQEREPGIFIQQASDGIRRIIAYEQVSLQPGDAPYIWVWAGIPESAVLAPANAVLLRNLLLMALVMAIVLAVSWTLGRNTLIFPIKRLVNTTENFAMGNLDARSGLSDKGDELGALARAFDDMADTLAASQALLREREEHLEEAQRIAHIGSWEWCPAAERPTCSKELCRLLGVDPQEPFPLLGELEKILSPDDAGKVRVAMETAMSTGEPYEVELEKKQEDGTNRWLLARGEVLRDEKGTIAGLRGTLLDVTERRLAEKEREKLQIQLSQAQKLESIGRLAGGVAHDFNNMLAVILGHAEMMLLKLSPADPLHAELQMIAKAAGRSADLTKQLLAFARKQIVEPKVLDLNETVEAILKMLRRLIGENIELTWHPAANPWPIKIDPSQVDQVLANICVNARDAIGETGGIIIETENVVIDQSFCEMQPDCVPGEYVMLAVRDNGCGMDRETLDNIFEPFFTTKEFGKGTGLGLATAYGIIRQNKGFVRVESEVGKGTMFRVYLPRFAGAMVLPDILPIPDAPRGKGESVLLVEDEPSVMEFCRRLLTSLGYTVLSAATPGDAMRLAAEHADSIHLLITDVIMPEMNGQDLAKRLQALVPGMKCLFMSGYTADFIAHQGVLDEGVRFIQKPFTTNELAQQVRHALD